jgi:hypothetical protein
MIGILISDGNSNVLQNNTIPEANLAKAAGILMYSIVVNTNNNLLEMQAVTVLVSIFLSLTPLLDIKHYPAILDISGRVLQTDSHIFMCENKQLVIYMISQIIINCYQVLCKEYGPPKL